MDRQSKKSVIYLFKRWPSKCSFMIFDNSSRASVVSRFKPGKPNPLITVIAGSIPTIVNLVNWFSVVFRDLGALGLASSLLWKYMYIGLPSIIIIFLNWSIHKNRWKYSQNKWSSYQLHSIQHFSRSHVSSWIYQRRYQ